MCEKQKKNCANGRTEENSVRWGDTGEVQTDREKGKQFLSIDIWAGRLRPSS